MAAAQDPASDPLLVSLSHAPRWRILQSAIYNAIWQKALSPEIYTRQIAPKLDAYFERYAIQCQDLKPEHQQNVMHWHVAKTVEFLRDENATKADIRARLRGLHNHPLDNAAIEALIPLAVRIWLMISVEILDPDVISGQTEIPWAEDERLIAITEELTFPRQMMTFMIQLSNEFKALNLERQAGFVCVWTSNLADHLLLNVVDGIHRVHIFHHVSFLQQHQATSCAFLPHRYVTETLDTLKLLFPQNDTKTRRWFKEKQTNPNTPVDPNLIKCGYLSTHERQIDHFHHWRDRLIELKQGFDDAEPRSLWDLWRDNRRKHQWWTFWIAVVALGLTVFFGFLQSVTGLVQAWASVKSLNQHT